jgi:hypothetical protein
MQPLRNPIIHKLRIVIQPTNWCHTAGIKAHFLGKLTDIS